MQKLTHAADTPVAQMVDIVQLAHALGQAANIVDGGKNIVHDNVLRNQNINILPDGLLQRFTLVLLHQPTENDKTHTLVHADLLGVEVHKVRHVHHAVGENADILAADFERDFNHAGPANEFRLFA